MMSLPMRDVRLKAGGLKKMIGQIRALPKEEPLSCVMLARLLFAWGNIGYSASVRYLQQVERLFRSTDGAILECGSGATTLLLALLAEKFDRHVWTFEHHDDWSRHMRQVTRQFGLENVRVCHVPLRSYGKFEWYEMPLVPLPRDFGLVVCDGPPGDIRGGRYGLMPVMQAYMRSDCRILLDDTRRRNEQALLQHWAQELRMEWNPIGVLGTCAELAFI